MLKLRTESTQLETPHKQHNQHTHNTALRRTTIATVLLALTNAATLAALLAYATMHPPTTPVSQASNALFAQNFDRPPPALTLPMPNISTPRMSRSALIYPNATQAVAAPPSPVATATTASHPPAPQHRIVAAGVNVIKDEHGHPTLEVHTEVVRGAHFGEHARADGLVGSKALRLRFVHPDGAESLLAPMSLSLRRGATLVPNLHFFSHRAADGSAPPVSSFVSTVNGEYTFFNDAGRDEWQTHMAPALDAYASAWLADHAGADVRRRSLEMSWGGLGTWVAGKAGGLMGSHYLGGSLGNTAAGALGMAAGKVADGSSLALAAASAGWSLAGTAATDLVGASGLDMVQTAKNLAHGEGLGEAAAAGVGSTAGMRAGAEVGSDLGTDIGGGLGAAVGGPAGAVVGSEVGAWSGAAVGGYVGWHLGHELGDDLGSALDSW